MRKIFTDQQDLQDYISDTIDTDTFIIKPLHDEDEHKHKLVYCVDHWVEDEQPLSSVVDLSEATVATLDLGPYPSETVQIYVTAAGDASVWDVLVSADGSTWLTMPSSSSISIGDGGADSKVYDNAFRHVRVSKSSGSVTSGTLVINAGKKG